MTNIQRTADAVELPVRSLSSAMTEAGHDRLDILKLDIEGAEYEVLDRLITDRLRPAVLCVEFDQPMPLHRTLGMTRRLVASGYGSRRSSDSTSRSSVPVEAGRGDERPLFGSGPRSGGGVQAESKREPHVSVPQVVHESGGD